MEPELTPWALTSIARQIYAGAPLTLQQRLTTVYRPLYGALEGILHRIPTGARQLDIGCGTGTLLLLADRLKRHTAGYGFDPEARSIRVAQLVNRAPHLHFICGRDVPADVIGACDVITVIDVLHHVPAGQRQALLLHLAAHARRGSLLLIRDLDPRPRWRAWANQVTDCLSTRSRVTYVDMQAMRALLEQNGFAVQHASHRMHYIWSPYLIAAIRR